MKIDRLKECLHYDPETGIFRWKIKCAIQIKIGDVAGNVNHQGYFRITIDYKCYLAHRLAWLYVYGELPKNNIDHIDGDKLNNAISNLRNVTQSINCQNRKKAQINNRTGYLGVSKHRNKYQATININGINTYLGIFHTAQLASKSYLKAKRLNHEGCTI